MPDSLFGLVGNDSWVARCVMRLTCHGKEKRSWISHTFNCIFKMTSDIIESLPLKTQLSNWKKYENGNWGVLVGIEGITDNQWDWFVKSSLDMEGRWYGFFSILKQAVDGGLSIVARRNIYFARRFHLGRNPMFYNICSWLTSYGLDKAGIKIYGWKMVMEGRGLLTYQFVPLLPDEINPDDLWDNVFGTFDPPPPPDWFPRHKFIITDLIGKLPPDLPESVVFKIHADLSAL